MLTGERIRCLRAIGFFVLASVLLNSPFASGADPGKNGRIAFVANLTGTRQLYTINPDGTDLFQVTNLSPANDPLAFGLDYSPNSQQIVFNHDMTGALELYVINADGTGLKQATHDGTASAWPRWSRPAILFGCCSCSYAAMDLPGSDTSSSRRTSRPRSASRSTASWATGRCTGRC